MKNTAKEVEVDQTSTSASKPGTSKQTDTLPRTLFRTLSHPNTWMSPQSTSRRSPPFFQKRLASKQIFKQRIKHYHQWLRSSIHLKTKFGQSSPDSIRLQGPSKRTGSGLLHPVSSVKERNRKGGKCKSSRVLLSPVSSPQASPNVQASNRPKQAQHLHTCRKVQNGNTRVHQGLSDSRGMGVVDRLIRRLPSHPHPPKLKDCKMFDVANWVAHLNGADGPGVTPSHESKPLQWVCGHTGKKGYT